MSVAATELGFAENCNVIDVPNPGVSLDVIMAAEVAAAGSQFGELLASGPELTNLELPAGVQQREHVEHAVVVAPLARRRLGVPQGLDERRCLVARGRQGRHGIHRHQAQRGVTREGLPVHRVLVDVRGALGLEEGQQAMQEQFEQRFSAMQEQFDQRFSAMQAQIDQRFLAVDQRFTSLEKRMDAQWNLTLILIAAIFGLIGFVAWDRKTAFKPLEQRLEKRFEQVADFDA